MALFEAVVHGDTLVTAFLLLGQLLVLKVCLDLTLPSRSLLVPLLL